MTLPDSWRKSNGKVLGSPDNFYARWRAQSGAVPALHEGPDTPPPETLLQAVWQQQRLLRDQLKTLDGQPLKVLHPGFRNREAGPDFRRAIIQFGDEPPRQGDVEVDLHPQGWHSHRHDVNPDFGNVILHVVWDAPRARLSQVPTLALRHVLDSPLPQLNWWLGHNANIAQPSCDCGVAGLCSGPLRELSTEKLTALFHQAARVRLESKAAQFQARARQAGWEQALWEGIFRALGYKQNIWPFQRLAELRPRWLSPGLSPVAIQARLLGIGGLLPPELTRKQSGTDRYLRRIWDQWWRERDEFSDCLLPRAVWRFSNLRPANHPQRRLALAAHWLCAGNLPARLERWIACPEPSESSTAAAKVAKSTAEETSLLRCLQVDNDDFWSWHWTLGSRRLPKPQPLLGPTRATDLAVNVILPWLWARAVEGKNQQLRRRVEQRYFAWPAAQDNARLRLARQRLLGCAFDKARSGDEAKRRLPSGAAAQQGLLQITNDFCERSDALCRNCSFPGLVREFGAH